jgi:UDP-GlcNAc3NAcA epimerase
VLEHERWWNGSSFRLLLVEPVGYLDMIQLEKHSRLIATDSGGVQKEAFFYGVPCVTLRTETEWGELVESGWNRLVPPESADRVASGIRESLGIRGLPVAPYGDGRAAQRIAAVLSGTASLAKAA